MNRALHPVVTGAEGRAAQSTARPGERGSALVLAILVAVVLTLLGVSFLMMSRTENLIAENEKLAAQAHYVAEAGARAVKRWFDEPGTAPMFPDTSVADRDLLGVGNGLDEAFNSPQRGDDRQRPGVELVAAADVTG